MICNVSGLLIFLTVCGIVSSDPEEAVDCRAFLFSPSCRGVATKRTTLENGKMERRTFDGKSFKELLKSLYIRARIEKWNEENDELMRKSTNEQEIGENVLRKYQQDRDYILHKLLAKINKMNNEIDNVPDSFYDNL